MCSFDEFRNERELDSTNSYAEQKIYKGYRCTLIVEIYSQTGWKWLFYRLKRPLAVFLGFTLWWRHENIPARSPKDYEIAKLLNQQYVCGSPKYLSKSLKNKCRTVECFDRFLTTYFSTDHVLNFVSHFSIQTLDAYISIYWNRMGWSVEVPPMKQTTETWYTIASLTAVKWVVCLLR